MARNEPRTHAEWMGACLRLARRHRGLTGTNPSVGTLLVKDGRVVGRGITAKGGRPHAERVALDQAGPNAVGSIAYVTLEPCAHHGATPPCAQALINAGVAEVHTAYIDPDHRVDGKGHAMLREAEIAVHAGQGSEIAGSDMRGYLTRKRLGRPMVTLKLAVSRDGMLGRTGEEVSITGPLARAMVHRMRAEHDAIAVGRGTVEADDPDLTCRLSGLEARSPERFIFDSAGVLTETSRLVASARTVPVHLISTLPGLPEHLLASGVRHFAAEAENGHIALPEVLDDLGARGISSLMLEGGAQLASSFLNAGLVDEIAFFVGAKDVGPDGIASPITLATIPAEFNAGRTLQLGPNQLHFFSKG
ncbi:bifunctional diaminohydroxyphosphoribosylaminopyrimidine deaminase/5-amino-6-(5-phosphoribosylamino)uracil reductase RibD [Ahrensia sp. R2A130]|uniref:bifunctional diaminohydroxyphosphoribosylaminopyrimidine deaminase/5-amino-6-(5-phosphoribosylamino)uracil reductase RibD n=1 Tax=Ahrensia sp. R2A130 TaxID=744979 RepID=UPI00058E2FA2|nr:bifunctional diaminohydroxyphosphoribosylaminopyrimidine deaminase/5-amino-6-(5-phosphoribosylamino)uracil reductase RibD [Ahrensia sp. R2A130]